MQKCFEFIKFQALGTIFKYNSKDLRILKLWNPSPNKPQRLLFGF